MTNDRGSHKWLDLVLHATCYMRHATRTNELGLLEPEGDSQMVKWSNGNLQDTSRHSSTPYTGFIPALLEVNCKCDDILTFLSSPIVSFILSFITCIQPAGSQEYILLLQAGIVSPKKDIQRSPVLRVPW